jgi:hypothetical protein
MWTQENRHHCDCGKLRYPCDLANEEWASNIRPDTVSQAWREQAHG